MSETYDTSGNFTTVSNEEYKRLTDMRDKFENLNSRLERLERDNQTLLANMCHH